MKCYWQICPKQIAFLLSAYLPLLLISPKRGREKSQAKGEKRTGGGKKEYLILTSALKNCQGSNLSTEATQVVFQNSAQLRKVEDRRHVKLWETLKTEHLISATAKSQEQVQLR